MRILICIDDTDDLESVGTGELADMLAATINNHGWGRSYGVTRHQLLVHPDIPYTSHNSSMCFEADMDEQQVEQFIDYAADFLTSKSAPGSDPGLCVAILDQIANLENLTEFGRKAKIAVLSKVDAYELAEELGVHLSEHGGTGQGVIGALAGVGLRLTGNDGRFKGKVYMNTTDGLASVREIRGHTQVDIVRSLEGQILEDHETVLIEEALKFVLLDGKSVLLVRPHEDIVKKSLWRPCSKQQLKAY
jgi:hypothetical protein